MREVPAWLPDAEALLERVETEYDRAHARFDAIDSKAALVLGFAATLLALTFDVDPDRELATRAVALGRVSGILAIATGLAAAWPRTYTSANLAAQRAGFAAGDSDDVLLTIVDSRISHVDTVASACRKKLRTLRIALSALAAEAALVGVAALTA